MMITAEDLKKAIDEKKDMVLIDVRTPEEFSRGRIAHSINIPIDALAHTMPSTVPNVTRDVYVYCLSGSRSAYAVHVLQSLGYTHIFDLEHGLLAWRAKYFPVETEAAG